MSHSMCPARSLFVAVTGSWRCKGFVSVGRLIPARVTPGTGLFQAPGGVGLLTAHASALNASHGPCGKHCFSYNAEVWELSCNTAILHHHNACMSSCIIMTHADCLFLPTCLLHVYNIIGSHCNYKLTESLPGPQLWIQVLHHKMFRI